MKGHTGSSAPFRKFPRKYVRLRINLIYSAYSAEAYSDKSATMPEFLSSAKTKSHVYLRKKNGRERRFWVHFKGKTAFC